MKQKKEPKIREIQLNKHSEKIHELIFDSLRFKSTWGWLFE
jgi:hypothetical protein